MVRSPRLLLVEDDRELGAMLDELLTGEGYRVDIATDGQRGLHLALSRTYDLLVVDRGLPAIEGLDLLGRLRSRGSKVRALVLSALGNPHDRVEGLDAGAEDYLGKPFDIEELLARLRALRRRHSDSAELLDVPGGQLTVATRSVRLESTEVSLSERETAMLAMLARNPRRVFNRSDLVAAVFEGADEYGVVDTYVHYLRRKLGRGVIETVRGLGYRIGAG